MKLIVDIKDEKAPFILELLKNFNFVKMEKFQGDNSEILEGIKEAVDEMKLIKAGKLDARDARDIINEL